MWVGDGVEGGDVAAGAAVLEFGGVSSPAGEETTMVGHSATVEPPRTESGVFSRD